MLNKFWARLSSWRRTSRRPSSTRRPLSARLRATLHFYQLEDRVVPASASLSQWQNLSGGGWVNGDLNSTKATLLEGDSVPYQDQFSGLSTGSSNVYVFKIQWETTKAGVHALDYLTTYDYTWHGGSGSGTSPVDGHELDGTGLPASTPFTTFSIPLDPNLNNNGASGTNPTFPTTNTMILGHTQVGGQVFKLYGGTISAIGGYTQYALTGDSFQVLNITFTASVSNPVLLWGGHIASRFDWGPGNSAGTIPGSPYHMFQNSLTLNGVTQSGVGSQDRALKTGVVILPTIIVVNKVTTPNAAPNTNFTFTNTSNVFFAPGQPTNFVNSFTLTGSNQFTVPPYALPPSTATNVKTLETTTFNNTTLTRITESVPSGWTLASIAFFSEFGNLGNSSSGSTAILNANGDDTLWVTFTDKVASTALVTTASPHGTITLTGSQTLNDSAVLSGGSNPQGTITFTLKLGTTTVYTNTVNVNGDGTYTTSPGYTLPSNTTVTGSYDWSAVYTPAAGDPNLSSSDPGTSAQEQLTINKATPSTSTTIDNAATNTAISGAVPLGTKVYDTATVTGLTGFTPTGTVTYNFYANNTGTGTPVSTQTVTLTNGTVPNSATSAALAAGNYSYVATYNGDGNYVSVTSPVEPLTVNAATPSTSTTIDNAASNAAVSSAVPLGTKVYDTATVTGTTGFTPTGTVTYKFYANGSGTGTPVSTQTVTLTNGTVPNSATTAALAAGNYSYVAVYSGDSNYVMVQSPVEPLTVNAATPTTSTTIFNAATNAAVSGAVPLGTKVYDTATVTGTTGFTPTGTVTYNFYANGSGTGTPISTQTVTLTNGMVPNSATTAALAAGAYSYVATYSGDSNYVTVQSPVEPLTVNPATVSTSTTIYNAATNTAVSGAVPLGTKVYDTDTITPISGFTPTGTVTYNFYANNTGTGTPISTQTVTLSNGQVPNSATTAALAAGTYSYVASYSGDSNYAPATSGVEPLTVNAATPTTSTTIDNAATNTAVSGAVPLGTQVYDTATVTGITGFTPTGTVTYNFYANGSGTGIPITTQTVTLSNGMVPNSATTVPLAAGNYSYVATYSGDSNYVTVQSPVEPLTVSAATPSTSTTIDNAATNTAVSGAVPLGTKVYDTATVTGIPGFTPTGTVTYNFYANGSGTGTPISTQTVTLSNGQVPNSATTAALAAGAYSYVATYSGDSNYATAQSPVEPLTVNAATPTTSTTIDNAATNTAISGPALPGVQVYDTAMVTGITGFTPTGTVTYNFYTNGNGSGTPVSTQTVTMSGGMVPNSATTAALGAGNYSYVAVYSGDSNYLTVTSPVEPLVVNKASPTLTTTASGAVTLGTTAPTLSDSAVLSGGYLATGSITFTLSGPGGFSYTQTDTVNGNGTYSASTTLPTTGVVAGTYTWTAQYSSDANNNSANDQGGTAEQTVVSAANPSLVTTASPNGTLALGTTPPTLNDSAALSGGYYETGTITFKLFAPGVNTTTGTPSYIDIVTIGTNSGSVTGNGTYSTNSMGNNPGGFTLPTTTVVTGTWTWTATYSSDSNNNTASDPGTSAQEQVNVLGPTLTITKTADASPVNSTDAIGFTITVSNTGAGAAYNVNVSDMLPAPTGVTWSTVTTTAGYTAATLSSNTISDMLGTLASGATVVIHVTGTTAAGFSGTLNNTATVTSTNNSPGSLSASASITVLAPNLTITKTGNGTVNSTDTVTFTIVVSNTGAGTAYNVNVSDPLPDSAHLTWTTDAGTISSGTLSDAIGSLAAGASVTIHVSAATAAGYSATLNNTATASSSNNSPGSVSASATDIVLAPNLTITKTGNGTVNSTDTVKFTIVVSNTGAGTAYNVNLSDPLPDSAHLTWTTDAGTITSGTLSDAIGSLASGASVTIHVSAATAPGYSATLNNTATASSSNNSPGSVSASATDTVLAPNLTITKTGNGTVNSTDTVMFTIVVSNTGAGTAYNVSLSDPLPDSAHLTWTSDAGTVSGGTLSDAIGSLAAGASVTIHVSASTAAGYSATLNNTATATASNNSPGSVSASATDVVLAPNLTITKTGNGTVNSTDTVKFTIVVSNTGAGTAYNVNLSDPLPDSAHLTWTTDAGTITSGTLSDAIGSLASGASVTIHVSAATAAGYSATLNNTATASASNNSPGSVSASATDTVLAPNLMITKTGNGTVNSTDTVKFTIVVSNTGAGTAYNVNVSDPLPDSAHLTWTTDAGTISSGTLSDAIGSLTSGASVTIHVSAATAPGYSATLNNTATASSSNNSPGSVSASATDTVLAPNLVITKTGNGTVNSTDTVTFTITVSNTGAGTAYNVALSDPLPDSAHLSWTSDAGTISGGTLSDAIGSLAAGASVTIHVSAATAPGYSATLNNTATASSSNNSPGSVSASATDIVLAPNLTITKTGNGTVNSTDTVKFTIVVSNTGAGTAYNVNVSDPLPDSAHLSWTTDAGTISSGTLSDAIGSLAAGASVTIHVSAATAPGYSATLNNTATASSSNNSPGSVNASATDIVLAPNLVITKTGNGTVNSTDTVKFTIVVSNTGAGTAYNVNLSDPLPDSAHLTWTTDAGTISSGTLSDAIGSLASGASVTIHVSAATAPGYSATLNNTATASSSNNSPASVSASATDTVLAPNLAITKTGNGTVNSTDTVMFTIVVSNTGAGTAYNVTVSDPLPDSAHLTWTTDAGTITSGTLSDAIGSLAAGASVTIHVSAATAAGYSATLNNTATASASNNSPGSVSASATDTVLAPNLTITKTGNGTVNSTDTVKFTIVVSNTGAGTAYNVNLSDPLPDSAHLTWTTDAGTITSGTLSDAIGSLAAGASVTIHVSAATAAGYSATLNNTATATSSNNSPSSVSASATDTVLSPNLTITKTGNGTVNSTDTVAFTITVSNTGAGTAYNVNLSDPLPDSAHLSWTTDAGTITSGTLSDAIGSLASGASVTIHVSAATAPGYSATLNNTATASASNNSPGSVSASATDTVLSPNLTITKTGNGTVNSTDTVMFTIVVSNTGAGTAYNVSVSDPLPDSAHLSWTTDAGTITSGALSDAIGSLAAGASVTIHVSATTAPGYSATLNNTATATASNNSPGSVTASATDTVLAPNLSITKTGNGTVNSTDTVKFTIVVSNTGAGTAYNVNLSDPLPDSAHLTWTTDAGTITSGTLSDAIGSLAAGASVTIHVSAATAPGYSATLNNTATATASNNSPGSVTASATDTVLAPNLTITKTGNGTVNSTDTVMFTIVVSNTGAGTAYNVSVSDPLPDSAHLSWTSDAGTITSGTLTDAIGSLASGASVTIHVSAATVAGYSATLNNTATASSSNNSPGSVSASATDTVLAPNLTITKTGNGTVNSTDTVKFTIVVSNTGAGTAYNVSLSDPLPDSAHLTWTTDAGTITSGTLSDAIGSLASGASITIHVSAATAPGYSATLNNTATASSSNNSPGSVSASATDTVLAPNLTITKTGNGTVNSTDTVKFTIVVSNTGAGTAYNVNVSDPLPDSAHLTWTTDAGTITSGTLSDAIGSLAAGASVIIHVSAATAAGYSATLNNTATASSSNNSPGSVSASATDTVLAPNLTITKTGNGTVNSTDTVKFTIVVSNTGAGTAYNVNLSDPLPDSAHLSWTTDAGTISSGTLSDAIGSLAAGANVTIHVSAATPAGYSATLNNTATASSSNNSPGSVSASATDTVLAPDLDVLKTADKASVTVGASVGFSIMLFNEGLGSVYGATLNDPLPALGGSSTWSIDTNAGSDFSGGDFVITGAPGSQILATKGSITMTAGETLTLHITGVSAAAGTLTNTATVTGTNESTAETTDMSTASITVNKASPTLVTTASSAITLGTTAPTISDSAVLSGGYFETGTIVFTLTGPGGFSYTQTDTVSGNGTYSASTTLPTTGTVAGTYTWTAHYSGDANNLSANDQGGAAEQTVVSPANPTLVTTASSNLTLGTTAPTLSDSAVLSGGYYETGSITFTLKQGTTTVYTKTVTVSGNGTYSSGGYTLPTTGTVTGTYTWTVHYSGDTNNNAANDQGGAAEQTVVSPAKPTVVTSANPTGIIYFDGITSPTLSDSAVLSGGYYETGTITFTLYSPSNTAVYTTTVAVSGNGTYTASTSAETAFGTYTWKVSYSGNSNNNAANDQGGAAEQVTLSGQVAQNNAATAGWWANHNGQALLNSYTGTGTASLGYWLSSNYPNLFGNLGTDTGAQVAAYFLLAKQNSGSSPTGNTYLQALTTALNIYVTTSGLGWGSTPASYGFQQGAGGLGLGSLFFNVGSNGASFGVANNTLVTVGQLLSYLNSQTVRTGGTGTTLPTSIVFYGGDPTLTNGANVVFDGINQKGDIK